MNLLLDTSAFLWFLTDDDRLPARIKELIRASEHEVWLSVVSFWEIQVKYQLGRLPLPEPPVAYIPRQRARHGIAALPLHEQAVAHLPKLPDLHRDPFDRLLICQAIEHQLSIVTADPLILAYPVHICWP